MVDAPATGHGLAFLKVPLAASRAVPVGPVGHNARRILKLLRDPERTGLVVVAIPEEMAVVEALEFHRLAIDELGIEPAAVVLNGCHERRFTRQEAEEILRLASGEDAAAPSSPASPWRPRCGPDGGRSGATASPASTRGACGAGSRSRWRRCPSSSARASGPDDIQILADRLEAA